VTTTAPKIGRRSVLWRALGKEMQRRHHLDLPLPYLNHIELAQQIAMAGFREDLWTHEPSELANLILDQPYPIPEDDQIYELELSITYRELAPDWDQQLNMLVEALTREPLISRFQGKGIQV